MLLLQDVHPIDTFFFNTNIIILQSLVLRSITSYLIDFIHLLWVCMLEREREREKLIDLTAFTIS